MLNVSFQGLSKSRMIHIVVRGRLISTRIMWNDPPPSFSVHKDRCDLLGRGRHSGRTGMRVRGGAAVVRRGHSARPQWIGSGENDHYRDASMIYISMLDGGHRVT